MGNHHSNQIGELIATIAALFTTPHFIPMKIITDFLYVIDSLTKHLPIWENIGWISIKNTQLFKKAAHLLKQCSATTHFKWIKEHSGNQRNEGSDTLAKEGTQKAIPDDLDLSIPREFDIQGAKLSTMTQAIAYKGILSKTPQQEREAATRNLQRAREAMLEYCGTLKTDEMI